MLKGKKIALTKPVIIISLAFLAGFALLASGAFGSDTEPGSVSDPLVTKSFVQNYVTEQLANSAPSPVDWQVKNLSVGDQFIGRSGVDMIVRTGKAAVVDPTGTGIPDLTDGDAVMSGQLVPKNHLFTFPRSDGRGIIAAEDNTFIMYRGGSTQ